MKSVYRKIVTTSLALQFSAGKMSMVFSAITTATVISMKFHINFIYSLLGCIAIVILVSLFVIQSNWIGRESNRINQLNGLDNALKRIEDKLIAIEKKYGENEDARIKK